MNKHRDPRHDPQEGDVLYLVCNRTEIKVTVEMRTPRLVMSNTEPHPGLWQPTMKLRHWRSLMEGANEHPQRTSPKAEQAVASP